LDLLNGLANRPDFATRPDWPYRIDNQRRTLFKDLRKAEPLIDSRNIFKFQLKYYI
jgi:hypothetical protein